MSVPSTMSIPISMDQVQGGPLLSQGTFFGGPGEPQFIAVGPGGQALQFQYGAGDFGHQPPPFVQMQAVQIQPQFSAQFQAVAPFGQGPPQYAQGPPQYGQGPPQYGPGSGMPQIAPIPMPIMAMQPNHGMGQPQFAQMQQQHFFQ